MKGLALLAILSRFGQNISIKRVVVGVIDLIAGYLVSIKALRNQRIPNF